MQSDPTLLSECSEIFFKKEAAELNYFCAVSWVKMAFDLLTSECLAQFTSRPTNNLTD